MPSLSTCPKCGSLVSLLFPLHYCKPKRKPAKMGKRKSKP